MRALQMLLWTQETCNPMPNFETTWNPIGSGIKFDPLVPDAPVLKAPEPMYVQIGPPCRCNCLFCVRAV